MRREERMVIAQQTTFLAERLAGDWVPDQGAAQQAAAQSRLERWCQLAAGGDWTHFSERLAWDGLDLAQARQLLTDGQRADWREPPAWTALLAEAVAQCTPADSSTDPTALINPFVSIAQARLQRAVGAQWLWLTRAAQAKLTDYLRQQLVDLAAPTLTHITRSGTGLYPTQPAAPDLATLCHAYPVLARQLVGKVMQWVNGCAEFLARLVADWPLLAGYIGQDTTLAAGSISDLRPGLSDPHAGGRTVWAVTIADPHTGGNDTATTIAYKPKALTQDCVWNNLIRWCNDQGLSPRLGHLWTLPRAGYGWMEWANPQPTAAADYLLYCQRVGMVLGLLHLLHASDCHAENVVTQGDQLLLVDAEMLLYPQISGQQQADPLDVLRTGLLPRWQVQQQGVEEISGLISEQKVDALAVATGYSQMMRFLAANWAELTGSDGPLAAFRQGAVRLAPRPTAAYLRLRDHLRHPAFLQRGIDFSLGIDQLARTYLKHPAHRAFWPLLAAEQAALSHGDVPCFIVPIDQSDWVMGTHGIAASLHWPAFALPTPHEEAQQQRLIHESLADAVYLPTVDRSGSLLALALHLGEILLQRAVPLAEGGLGWIAHQFQPRSGLHQPGLVGDDLYSGRAGIALFLAALYRATGDDKWRTAALAGLCIGHRRDGANGATLGGQCYALCLAAELLAAPELAMTALSLGQGQESTATTGQVTGWGVVDGQAGRLLGLLALHHQLPAGRILPQAVACGDALLAGQAAWLDPAHGLGGFAHGVAGIAYALTQLYLASGATRFLVAADQGWARQQALYCDPPGQWQDRRGATPVYLANWCNGAAGIGLAAAASLQVMPHLAPQLMTVAERAASVLSTTTGRAPLDTLCCGRFGQIDSLLEMGVILQRSNWIEQAAALARTALPAASALGYFHLYDDLPSHLFNPTFFRGVAGIGYTLLRLATVTGESKGTLPCVLRWGLER